LHITKNKTITKYLDNITTNQKSSIQAQYIARRIEYFRDSGTDCSTISQSAINEFEKAWVDLNSRMEIIPGKTTLRTLRENIQNDYGVNLTDIQIVDEFHESEIPIDLKELVYKLETFRRDKT